MDTEFVCAQIRSLVQDCLAKHMHGSAVFYANKLITLGNHPGDVLLLADVSLPRWRCPAALLPARAC